MSKRISYGLAVLILLVAAGLRLWNLTGLPAGFSDLEISHIDVVLDEIQQGDIRVFYEREVPGRDGQVTSGQEGLYHIVLASVSIPFGVGTFGLRYLSVLLGMVTIAVVYALGTRLFDHRVSLIATSFYAVMMFPVLLSRLVVVETTVPLVVAGLLLALARALPVYERVRVESSNTRDYAVAGILISLSLYVHASSLFLVLMAMAFITYIMVSRRQVSMRRLSYIGFMMLLVFIIAMPYLISTWRLPELGASSRLAGDYEGIIVSIIDSTRGLMLSGDTNPLHNVPGRPLVDIVSGFILVMGLVFSIQNWRNPRYALILIAVVLLAPPAILADNSPNFLAMSVVLPLIALLIGAGAGQLIALIPKPGRAVAVVLVVILWLVNFLWTVDSLFNTWVNLEEVRELYHQDTGDIARHLDQTAQDIPVVLCNPQWDRVRATNEARNEIEIIKLQMNRDSVRLHEVDCRNGFLFVNAGQHQQVVIREPMRLEELNPLVADWLTLAEPVEGLPENSVFDMQVQEELEDALGIFTTSSPASYANEADLSERIPVAPPIRFGGNLTWLGYESDPGEEYEPGAFIPVTTYWRIEGNVPGDLVIFTHLLSDPIFPAAQIDTLYINPEQLNERDVYLHATMVPLRTTIEAGDYVVSVGAYQSTSDERLPVFDAGNATRGNRIFLYQIGILPENTD